MVGTGIHFVYNWEERKYQNCAKFNYGRMAAEVAALRVENRVCNAWLGFLH